MTKVYTCDSCGYALLTIEEVATRSLLVWFPEVGWTRGDPEPKIPYECADKNDCMRRRRDKVAGRRVLRNIDRRKARQYRFMKL